MLDEIYNCSIGDFVRVDLTSILSHYFPSRLQDFIGRDPFSPGNPIYKSHTRLMWDGWENFPMIISTFAGIPTAQKSAYIIGFAFSTFSVSLRNNRVYSKIRLSQNLSMALYVQMNDHELLDHFWRLIWFWTTVNFTSHATRSDSFSIDS